MAQIKISELPAATTPITGSELVPIVQNGITSKTLVSNFISASYGYTPSGTNAVARSVSSKLQEYVSVKDFGAVGDGLTNDTAAIQSAMNAAVVLEIPAGTYNCGALIWPNSLKSIVGSGDGSSILQATGSIPGLIFISLTGITKFNIENIGITVSLSTYPNVRALELISCVDGQISNITFAESGAAAIRGSDCTDITISNCIVSNWTSSGITFPNTTGNNSRIKVINCYVPGTGTQASHNINIIGGGSHLIQGCVTTNNVIGSFGANVYLVTGAIISNNVFSNGVAEGTNAQDSSYVQICNNLIVSSSSSKDFGISLYGSNVAGANVYGCSVTDNIIVNAGKAGVAFAGYVNNSKASGNLIINPNIWIASPDHANWGGVTFYGLGCNSNIAQENYTYDTSANVKYSVNEWNDGTGSPNYNQFIDNPYSATGLTAEIAITGANSLAWMTQWASYTPTVTPTAGAVTSTINSASYKVQGKTVEIQWDIAIPTSTGSGALAISLPTGFAAGTNGGAICGQEKVTNGWLVMGVANGSGVNVVNYANAFPGAATSRFVMSGLYKAA